LTVQTSSAPPPTPPHTVRGDNAFFGHPRGLATLFSTEMFERFSYYGMRAILVLYLSTPTDAGGLGLPATTAIALYAIYNSTVYLAALPGGWLADRVFGGRRAVLYGGIIIMAGHILLALPGAVLAYLGLATIAAGTGLLKPTISALVGGLYSADDPRRDAGFSIFYLGINLGAFIAPLITGWLGQEVSYHAAFLVAAVGMGLALLQYVLGGKWLGDVGLTPAMPLTSEERAAMWRKVGIWTALAAGALAVHAVVAGGIELGTIINGMTIVAIALPVVILTSLIWRSNLAAEDVAKVRAFVYLFVGAAIFWMIYDQAGSVLMLFAENNTDRDLLGFVIPTGWFASLSAMFVIALAPVFAWFWVKLGSRQPVTVVKFAMALVLIGSSFGLMAMASQAAASGALVSPLWLVGVNLLQVFGELMLSPVGLSATSKLAPSGLTSQFLGLWFLATAVGNAAAAQLARLTTRLDGPSYFLLIGALAVAAGAALFMIKKSVSGLMGERGS
jgi:proton-dependent oligopeptide transporter, POT family